MDVSSNLFHLVIEVYDNNNKKDITQEMLLSYLNDDEFVEDYYFIEHNKDEGVRPHYHIMVKLYKDITKHHLIKDLCRFLLVSEVCIQCKVVRNFKKSLRYLTHKDELDKYHYREEDVISKTFGVYESKCEMAIDTDNLTYNDIYDLCSSAEYISEVYSAVGLKNAKLYRNVISDIFRECRLYGDKK